MQCISNGAPPSGRPSRARLRGTVSSSSQNLKKREFLRVTSAVCAAALAADNEGLGTVPAFGAAVKGASLFW